MKMGCTSSARAISGAAANDGLDDHAPLAVDLKQHADTSLVCVAGEFAAEHVFGGQQARADARLRPIHVRHHSRGRVF